MVELKIGDQAPDFEAENQNGALIKLSELKGKKVVLYFYPKDDTPGCTKQACNLRDNYELLQEKGYIVLGVSADKATKHQKFISKYNLPFDLLVDVDKVIMNKYGAWGLKKFMGREYHGILRMTFVIDENGIIEDIISKVKTKDHTNQILA